MITNRTDILIIGAGPAGTVAAANLLKQGFTVTILEKSIFPRFTIGESLLPKVMPILEKNDLLQAVEACNFQKKHGAQFIKDGKTCSFDFSEKHTIGWDWTWQVSRADFDKALANEVESKGAIVFYDTCVKSIIFGDKEVEITAESSGVNKHFTASFIIDASGNAKVIPRLLNLPISSNFSSREAAFTRFKEEENTYNKDRKNITVVIHQENTWIWIIPLKNGICSVGVVSEPSFFEPFITAEKEIDFMKILSTIPEIKDRFKDLKPVFKPVHLKAYSSSVEQYYGDRYVLVGNATEFLDPVFSSGVTLAVESAEMAANIIGRQLNKETVNWETEYTIPMKNGINTFRTYVEAWYSGELFNIFFTSEDKSQLKSQICSVLAGYVWDETNPFVKKHKQAVSSLAKLIKLRKGESI